MSRKSIQTAVAAPAAAAVKVGRVKRSEDEVGLLTALTLVLWIGCLIVGLFGLLWPTQHAAPPPADSPPPPVQAMLLQAHRTPPPLPKLVKLTATPAPALQQPQAAPPAAPPPLPAVAEPSPFIAFAIPVSGPVRLVDALRAGTAEPARPAPVVAPVRHLTFGVGEGNQPPPQYPYQAAIAGEQGTVGVLFSVASDGSVLNAQAAAPCAWPLLNQAAVEAVLQTWHFPAGPPRRFEVSIEFQLVH